MGQRTVKPTSGFTIVELLIVIVVIGVIAALVVSTFSGVQERAESTRITDRARAYVKALNLWEAEADAGRPETASCIAPPSYSVCPSAYGWNVNVPNDPAFNASLKKYSGLGDPILGKYGPTDPVGLMWYHPNYYGDNRSVLFFAVGPNSNCNLSGVLSPPHSEMTLSGADYTGRTASYTFCIIQISKW